MYLSTSQRLEEAFHETYPGLNHVSHLPGAQRSNLILVERPAATGDEETAPSLGSQLHADPYPRPPAPPAPRPVFVRLLLSARAKALKSFRTVPNVPGLVCVMLCSVAFFFGRFTQQAAYLPEISGVSVEPGISQVRCTGKQQVRAPLWSWVAL